MRRQRGPAHGLSAHQTPISTGMSPSGFTPSRSAKKRSPRSLLPDLRERYPKISRFLFPATTDRGNRSRGHGYRTLMRCFSSPFFDWPPFVNRTLRLRPAIRLMLIPDGNGDLAEPAARACRKHGVKTILVNGRISVAILSAVSMGPAILQDRVERHRSVLHAKATNRPGASSTSVPRRIACP